MKKGKVYIVGAGPGDPRLITVRGLQCLREADAVVYDRLIDSELLAEAQNGAELICVGKESGKHLWPQERINELLVELALGGKIVTRLKGGDPFVFGRGGEEAACLTAKDIAVEIIPGVSSCIAVPAFAGIPVTHRGVSNSFAVATGHPCPSGGEADFLALYRAAGTLVVLMGVERRTQIAESLLNGNIDPSTPVVVIEQGSRAEQKVTVTKLQNIGPDCVSVKPPAVLVIGPTVNLRHKIKEI